MASKKQFPIPLKLTRNTMGKVSGINQCHIVISTPQSQSKNYTSDVHLQRSLFHCNRPLEWAIIWVINAWEIRRCCHLAGNEKIKTIVGASRALGNNSRRVHYRKINAVASGYLKKRLQEWSLQGRQREGSFSFGQIRTTEPICIRTQSPPFCSQWEQRGVYVTPEH